MNRRSPLLELCDPASIHGVVGKFLKGQGDASEDLWRLLVLEEWQRTVHRG